MLLFNAKNAKCLRLEIFIYMCGQVRGIHSQKGPQKRKITGLKTQKREESKSETHYPAVFMNDQEPSCRLAQHFGSTSANNLDTNISHWQPGMTSFSIGWKIPDKSNISVCHRCQSKKLSDELMSREYVTRKLHWRIYLFWEIMEF